MARREAEDGDGFWHVGLKPAGKAGGRLLITSDCVFETSVSLGGIVGVEDSFDVSGDIDPHRDLRDVGHGVLDRVKLTTLPRHSGHDGLSGRLETGMIVTDNELHAVHAAVQKALQELPPVVFGLAEFDAAAEDGPLAVRGYADGRKDRTGDNGTAVSDLFVPGIEDKVGDLTDGPVPPGFEFLVELGGSSADLGRSDLEATELLHDGRDLSGADTAAVHLGDRQDHGPLAADSPLQALGVEGPPVFIVVAAGLRDTQRHLAHPGADGLGLESVGVALTVGRSLMGSALSVCSRSICMARFMMMVKAFAIAPGPCSMSSVIT